ncbi:hypothetical protein ACFWDG_18760 [Peribacillus sp. NPDC060186]
MKQDLYETVLFHVCLGIKKAMEESAESGLYAGVHFKVDIDEGLRLGRQIGEMLVRLLRAQNLTTLH